MTQLGNKHEDKKTWKFNLFCLLLGLGGNFFLSVKKLQLLCPPFFVFFFFKSRFFTSLLLRFSGEVDVLSQVVWAVKCNLLSVASSNMYSTHNISPLSLSLALRSSTPSLFSYTVEFSPEFSLKWNYNQLHWMPHKVGRPAGTCFALKAS